MSDRVDSMDARLRESEERYRGIIDNASDMIQSVRPDGTFEFVNPAWHRTLGFNDDDLATMTIWDIVHPDSLQHCQELFSLAMQGHSIPDVRTTFQAKDGRAVPVEGSVTVRMVDDELIATHAFFRDISERLHAEELEARNAQLEQEQRARYLEKMAALGKLSAGLAHELNNPASAARRASASLEESCQRRDAAARGLRGCAMNEDHWQLLEATAAAASDRPVGNGVTDPLLISEQEDALADWLADHDVADGWQLAPSLLAAGVGQEQLAEVAAKLPPSAVSPGIHWIAESLAIQQSSNVVARSTSRMSDLVSAIKAYSYMDRASELLVDVHDGLENTLVILAHRLQNVTIVRDYDRSLPSVLAHGSGLNQVWTNLLDNAIDAMDRSGTITIRTCRADDDLIVELNDSGRGIDPEHLTRVFEPFFTTKAQGSGTGLGLDVVWRIVTEDHGGRVEVDSTPGSTTFRVALPIPSTAD